jgi:hypothetical protein
MSCVPLISIETMIDAIEVLPIISRLQITKQLLCLRGGDKESAGADASLVAAVEVLEGVIKVLNAHPSAGQLRYPEP